MNIKNITKGVLTARAVAQLCGITVQAVYKWERSGRIPAEHAIAIAQAVDFQITPHELRPDIYPNPQDGLPVIQEAA